MCNQFLGDRMGMGVSKDLVDRASKEFSFMAKNDGILPNFMRVDYLPDCEALQRVSLASELELQ